MHVIKRRRLIIIVAMALLLAVILAGLFIYFRSVSTSQGKSEKPISYSNLSKELNKEAINSDNLAPIVQKYGTSYDAVVTDVFSSDPTKWNQLMLDKAYFGLLYTDKLGATSQVEAILAKLELASRAGIDINNNAAGIGESERKQIETKYSSGASTNG